MIGVQLYKHSLVESLIKMSDDEIADYANRHMIMLRANDDRTAKIEMISNVMSERFSIGLIRDDSGDTKLVDVVLKVRVPKDLSATAVSNMIKVATIDNVKVEQVMCNE